MKSAKISTLKKYRMTSSSAVIRLVGGVLLVALFALVPNRVSAYNNNFDSTGSSFTGWTRNYLRGACAFGTYYQVNWNNKYFEKMVFGSNRDNASDICNYRVVNGALNYYDNNSVGYYQYDIVNGVSSQSPAFTDLGNYHGQFYWSNDDSSNFGSNMFSTLYKSEIYLNNSLTIPSKEDISNQKSMFIYRFQNIYDKELVSQKPVIDDSSISVYDSDNNLVTGNTASLLVSTFKENTNLTLNIACDQSAERIFPSVYNYDFAGNSGSCYIVGSFYTNPQYHFVINNLIFSPAPDSDYDLTVQGGLASNALKYLARNYYSYKYNAEHNNTNTQSFANIIPRLFVINCDSSSECDEWVEIEEKQVSNRNSGVPYTPDTDSYGSSVFMSWFNVFTFGFTFPFTNLFNAFTDSQCVDIPIIAGMLHANSNHYCSWWSSDVRSVVTPVFSLASIMLLFGFLISWLRSDSHPLGFGSFNSNNNGGKE